MEENQIQNQEAKEKKNPHLKLDITFFVLTLIISVFSWWTVERAINVEGASNWLVPIFSFLIFFIIICLDIVLVRNKWLLYGGLFLSLGLSLAFTPNIFHTIFVVFSFLLLVSASQRIKSFLKILIKISFWRSIRYAKLPLVLSVAIAITSMYYFEVSNATKNIGAPKAEIGTVSDALVSRTLPLVVPGTKDENGEDATVDQFLLQLGGDLAGQQMMMLPLSGQNKEELEEAILIEKRKGLSDLVGREVFGDEKITPVISEIVNNKVNSYVSPNIQSSENSSWTPLIFSFVLFLTIISIGPFLIFLGTILIIIIFKILVASKAIEIDKVNVEKEVIK